MGLPSGTFSSLYPGSLRVSASASISGSAFDNNYEAWGTSSSDIVLRAWINNGSTIYLPILSRSGPASEIWLAYPGGGAVWTMGMEELSYTISGAGSVWAQKIHLVAELFKR